MPVLCPVLLELAARCSKCVPERDIWNFVRMVDRMHSSDHDLLVGNGNFDSKLEQRFVVTVLMWRLDNDLAAHDLCAELFQPQDKLAIALFESRRVLHVANGICNRKFIIGRTSRWNAVTA
jgi:hypothetical protein